MVETGEPGPPVRVDRGPGDSRCGVEGARCGRECGVGFPGPGGSAASLGAALAPEGAGAAVREQTRAPGIRSE